MGQKQEADQKIPGQPTNRLAPAHNTKVTCYSRLRVRTHTYTHVCRHTLKHIYTCVHTHTHICTYNMHMCTHNITGVRIQSRQSISQLWAEAGPLSVDTTNRPCFSAGPSHLRKSRPSPHTSPCHAAASALCYHSR